uniref:Transposase n=1 Tax=Heterorhabditis bacteriophora TaxID=37862 RepID=A0A1I7WTT7_HETBA
MAVQRTVKRYKGLGTVKDRPRSGRSGATTRTFFSLVEGIFTVNPAFNSENNRQLLQRGHQWSEKASINTRSHFPSPVMILAEITASGKDPLVFVEENVKINAKY